MNILALDLATRTGWALRAAAPVNATEHGVQVFDVRRGESPGMRYLRFNRWLDEVSGRGAYGHRVDLIIYEQTIPWAAGGTAREIAHGFATRVQELCATHKIDHFALPAATLKKWTTGKGNARKPVMIAAVRERWGYPVTDDNEADALALLHYALAELVGTAAR